MPGPNRAPRGGYQKPKDLKKTVSRLLGYLTRSKLPLLAVLAFLLLSVATNIGGSYMMRGIINDFVWSGWFWCSSPWSCSARRPPMASRPLWSSWPSVA